MFFTPTVASAAEASTQDVVSKSDTILQADSVLSHAGYVEPQKAECQVASSFKRQPGPIFQLLGSSLTYWCQRVQVPIFGEAT